MEFFGYWVAEGHTTAGKNGDYNVILSNSDRRLVTRMVSVLQELGYKPLILETKPGRFQVRIRNFQLFSYLNSLGHSHQKYVPVEIKLLARELLVIFLVAYLKGDGHVHGRTMKGLSATTTSVRLRDDLQELALKVGMSAYFKLGTRKGTPIGKLNGGKYKSAHDTWIVYFIRHNRPSVTPSVLRKSGGIEVWSDFHGMVYCVSVPNQAIYVRRNGIPVWCGNSDPPMNWRLSSLDRVALVSNSDAHSPGPWRLGREANVFELSRLCYSEVFSAIRDRDPARFLFTVEVDPAYGKYHNTGHSKCGVSVSPAEAARLGNRCPKCGRALTVGVLQRVEELADRPEGYTPVGAIPFRRLLPLYELISYATGARRLYAKKVLERHERLIRAFGSEFAVLLKSKRQELTKVSEPRVADAIIAAREGRVKVTPGYDGVYGIPRFT
jgi:hypothetical protein